MALAPLPLTPSYAISKAACVQHDPVPSGPSGWKGVSVHAVLTGPTDTEMTAGFDIPKATRESVARAIFDGIENGEEDIFPDADVRIDRRELAQRCSQSDGARNASFVAPQPVGV